MALTGLLHAEVQIGYLESFVCFQPTVPGTLRTKYVVPGKNDLPTSFSWRSFDTALTRPELPDQKDPCLNVRIALPKYSGLLRLVERVRRPFDLGADPLHIVAHLSRDCRLKPPLHWRPALRVPGVWDAFEVAVRAILGQAVDVCGFQ